MNIITFLQYANQTPCVQATIFNTGPIITSALTPNLPPPIQPIILEGLAQAQQTYRVKQDRLHSVGGGSGDSYSTREVNATQQRNNQPRQPNNNNNNASVKAQVKKFINSLAPKWWNGNSSKDPTNLTFYPEELGTLRNLPNDARDLLPGKFRNAWDSVHSGNNKTIPLEVIKKLQQAAFVQ